MYQLIQIPFQNFFSILCTNPNTYLPSKFFSVFYVPTVPHPLLTSIPPRPARIRTTSQTRRTKPHLHHHTPADTFPRPPPPCRTTVPYSQPYHRTTVPLHRTPNHTTVQPYHCTVLSTVLPTAPPHHRTAPPDTPSHHPDHIHITSFPTMQPHDPDTRRPDRRRPDAASTPSRRRPRRDRRARRRRAPADVGDGVDATHRR